MSTKQVSPQLYWFFTLNNYNMENIEYLRAQFQVLSEWFVFQEEIGESGTKHLQGTIKLKAKGRPFNLFPELKLIHWEKTKSVKNAIEYCTKEQTRNGEIYTNLLLPKPLRVLDVDSLYPWQRDIYELCMTEPDDRTIYWFYDRKGATGKTALAKMLCARYGAICVSGKGTDCKHGIVDYIEKNKVAPIIIIMNIPRCNIDYISYEAIESIKDGLFFSGKYESGQVVMNCPHVIIFANEHPDTSKLSADRWFISNLDEDLE